jgi:hypothetical protein
MLNNIKKVVVYDGDTHLQNKDVIEHKEYKLFYGIANVLYQNFVEDINQSEYIPVHCYYKWETVLLYKKCSASID